MARNFSALVRARSRWSSSTPAAAAGRLRPPRQVLMTAGACSSSRAASVAKRSMSDFLRGDAAADETGPLSLAFAAACLPHPDKQNKGGEDAYYACLKTRSFGVADGVGGWAGEGIDPGQFARCLLRFAIDDVRRSTEKNPAAEADLQKAFLASNERLRTEKEEGGSTVLLGQLNGRILTICNLGDSGVLVLRPALRSPPGCADKPLIFPRVIFKSTEQQHYFNCPYQLDSSDAPVDMPDIIQVKVRPGDLIMAATDGVFDNLFNHQLQAMIAMHLGPAWRTGADILPHLESCAKAIAEKCQFLGKEQDKKDVITPFGLAATSEGLAYRGGKLDDTTLVFGLVCDKSQADVVPNGGDASLPYLHNFSQPGDARSS